MVERRALWGLESCFECGDSNVRNKGTLNPLWKKMLMFDSRLLSFFFIFRFCHAFCFRSFRLTFVFFSGRQNMHGKFSESC